MFHFLKSERGKLRDHAKNWLYLANKVYHFRKDELNGPELDELSRRMDELKSRLRARGEDSGKLKFAIEGVKGHLEKVGGEYYPRSSLADNVEFFFVALIIYVGVTSFFVKPFKIPTNSMWPTYFGMTGQVYQNPEDGPGVVARAARLLAFGANHYDVEAPASGELMLPVVGFNPNGDWAAFAEPATSRRFFILPTPGKRVWLRVGEEKTSFKVLADFSVEAEAISPMLGMTQEELSAEIMRRMRAGQTDTELVNFTAPDGSKHRAQIRWVKTGRFYEKGDTILSFDLLTGDQLFVDRASYHFVRPEVGDGFVFKTEGIVGLDQDKFYIKRLAGTPGDVAQIVPPTLMVNGQPATGSIAFALNAEKAGLYDGYVNAGGGMIDLSEPTTVPDDSYLALGDNSDNSLDSRVWGFVPEENVIGRPIMIYYPITRRFGLSQ